MGINFRLWANTSEIKEAVVGTPLQKLEGICAEIYSRWDKDMRSGKLLGALAGSGPFYRQDVTDVRNALGASDDMLAALLNVRKIISEGAETGFNCHEGDWAERLFLSQQMTSAAIRQAEGRALAQAQDRHE